MNTGYVYKLVCDDVNIAECYVGSTGNFNRRKHEHKSRCNNESDTNYNFRVYQFIRTNGGFENWSMIQVESMQFSEKRELTALERYWTEELHATLNSSVPGRTMHEYATDHKNIQTCICGVSYNYGKSDHRKQHYRSQKHQAHIQLIHDKLNISSP